MDVETEANPASGDEVTLEEAQAALNPEVGAEAEAQSSEEADELDKLAGLEPEEGEPGAVDVEYEGKTYKLPPELKDAVLRQADYTKKTMSLAEERKAVEAAKAHVEEIASYSQESRTSFVQAAALRMQLESLLNTPVDGLRSDQLTALRLDVADMERQIEALESTGKQAVDKERSARSQQIAKARAEVVTEAAKIIPNFNDQRRTELESVAVSLGASPDFVQQITDPLVYKTLHFADIGMKFVERQRKAKTVADAQQAQPAEQIAGKARAAKNPAQMSPAEMAKHLGY
jgi:hypothetical protein